MGKRTCRQFVLLAAVFFMLSGCVGRQKKIFETEESQVALRNMQSRIFETNDRTMLLRTIISTLQDLGFIIDKADHELGSVSGTKRSGYSLRMTVSARQRSENSITVRCNAQYGLRLVEDPEPYQRFFSALSKALFLDAQMISEESPVAERPSREEPAGISSRAKKKPTSTEERPRVYEETIPFGMPPEKVKELLGEPYRLMKYGKGESWYYEEPAIEVIFYEGKVATVEERN